MTEINALDSEDAFLERLKSSRKSPAVLKVKLASIRSYSRETTIFAFEGDDDKAAFFQWIMRIRPGFSYEPFPCSGKKGVLQLRQMVARDLGGLGEGVYYFIDRDFDDLRGHSPGPDLFMTDRYSIESYLVAPEVLAELLKNEFHCHAEPQIRERVLRCFNGLYAEFLKITRDINLRLFIAKRAGIELKKSLPDKLAAIATVKIDEISPSGNSAADIVDFSSEPDSNQIKTLSEEFASLDPYLRFRGKFALMFFMKWLEHLATERQQSVSGLFAGIDGTKRVKIPEISIGSLASKSDLPVGLQEFVMSVGERTAA
jgi:hypothetical protein